MPNRPAKWARVEPSKVTNRPPGGGTFDDVTGKDFTWTGLSYRQASIVFDKPIDRIVLVFSKGGTINYKEACTMSGVVSASDFRDKGPVFKVNVPHKKGTFSIGSAAPSHDCWIKFTDIYGEVAA
jgi:hypothetical protein